MNRRQWLRAVGAGCASGLLGCARGAATSGAGAPAASTTQTTRAGTSAGSKLTLEDFQPKSMLHVPATHVPRARFPVIDVHTHLTWSKTMRHGVAVGEENTFFAEPAGIVEVMAKKNVKMMVNLTGGTGKGLESTIAALDRKYEGRFATLTEPSYGRWLEPKYPQIQADAIEHARKAGARGLKVLKTLGLYLREQLDTGPLVKIDDRRFDPMWEACAAQKMPVWMHVSDPEAFFLPTDRNNERYEELSNHPDWSFHGKDFPSNAELLEARNRVIARHPKVTFLLLHVGNAAENLGFVSRCLDTYPNTQVEIGARIGELGRQPRTCRKFFDRYQDRILFGTDAIPRPAGNEVPQQVFTEELYEIYYRFLETEDEYFDYAPAPVPPQGRWAIYGIGLPESILKKVYHDNAARLLGLSA
ncbi:amidohydrolase family protein [Pendulispora albinea]|uniref:Amidohydrolase n=1 Tax=Pendulispora albinea TaxID=2741071 RepID=A0ABZ2LPH2_9BACT